MSYRGPRNEYRLFAERLQQALDAAGKTQSEASRALGFSKSMMSLYVNARSMPESDRLYRIAEYLNVDAAWLFGATVNPDGTAIDSIDGTAFFKVKKHMIPLLGNIACGQPILADDQIESYIDPEDVNADFALHAKGDSMVGDGIRDGDIVYVRQQNDVNQGDIAVVMIDDEATLKHVFKMQGEVQLYSSNAKYPPISVREGDGKNVAILGKAVGYYHTIERPQEENYE